MIGLHNLPGQIGAKKRKKVVGRGNSSGHGTYSTRGGKGQTARTGGSSGLKLFGLRSVIMRTPKSRGFKSLNSKLEIVNLGDIERVFSSGAIVSPKELLAKGLIATTSHGVKILNKGKLTKPMIIKAQAFSAQAKLMIEAVKGEAKLI